MKLWRRKIGSYNFTVFHILFPLSIISLLSIELPFQNGLLTPILLVRNIPATLIWTLSTWKMNQYPNNRNIMNKKIRSFAIIFISFFNLLIINRLENTSYMWEVMKRFRLKKYVQISVFWFLKKYFLNS